MYVPGASDDFFVLQDKTIALHAGYAKTLEVMASTQQLLNMCFHILSSLQQRFEQSAL